MNDYSFARRALVRTSAALLFIALAAGCGGSTQGNNQQDDGFNFGGNDIGDSGSPCLVDCSPEQTEDGIPGVDSDEGWDSIPGVDSPVNPESLGIRITGVNPGQTVQGSVKIRLEPIGKEEWILDKVALLVGDVEIFTDSKLPTDLVLDSREYENGVLGLKATAMTETGSYSDAVDVQVSNLDFSFISVTQNTFVYSNGNTILITVDAGRSGLNLTPDFSGIDSGYQSGAGVVDNGDGTYSIAWAITQTNARPDGDYLVPLVLTDPSSGTPLNYNGLTLHLQNTPEMPVQVDGGIFVNSAAPMPSTDWMQPITLLYGNDFIVTGGSALLNVDFSGYAYAGEIIGVIVQVEGYSGYYQLPVENPTGEEELLLRLRPYLDTETPPASLTLLVAVQDEIGKISPYKSKKINVTSVGSGDVQVTVSWDTATDVDLHVVEPGGCEIYYGNDMCGSGGWLDLDSNAGCDVDGVNAENIFWPEGQAPTGTFTVRVDFWEDCHNTGANYMVTINNCGTSEVYNGSFNSGADTHGGSGDGVTIATFNNENCGRLLRGTVRYEDRDFTRWGFTARTWRPVRYAQVELHRTSDDAVLGTAWTDQYGRYNLTFGNQGPSGVYLKVSSKTNHEVGLRKISVMMHPKFGNVYTASSEAFDESLIDYPVQNLDITEAMSAGAFNILDVLIQGHDLSRLKNGRELGLIEAFWATGADTTDTIYCSQYLYDQGTCSYLGGLSIQGKDTDRDEYDDMVILKEFYKLVLERAARDSHPGGTTDSTRDDPTRAWTEGAATFLSCAAARYPWFVNSRPAGVYIVKDIETPDTPFAVKTGNSTAKGKISELMVAAILWDLYDGTGAGEPHDLVDSQDQGVFDSIFNYLPSSHFSDRGYAGVDLVDFLDGWFCRGWGQVDKLITLVQDYHQFPYDFLGLPACTH